jgi:hypothetical protein
MHDQILSSITEFKTYCISHCLLDRFQTLHRQASTTDIFTLFGEQWDMQISEIEHFLGSLVMITAGNVSMTVPVSGGKQAAIAANDCLATLCPKAFLI